MPVIDIRITVKSMMTVTQSICPGCGLHMPVSETAAYQGYYNTTPECWSVYAEALGQEYSNVMLFGRVHQLTVDSYAVQHAGGAHPDKSITIHLAGLHLVLARGISPPSVPRHLQRLANGVQVWPHFPPPTGLGALTIFDVALADSAEAHINRVRAWASQVWQAWSPYHAEVADLVSRHLSTLR